MPNVAVSAVAGAALLVFAGTLTATPQVARDPTLPQPQTSERRIPIGSATLSGTVSTADGRAIAGARVSVSGQVPQNMTASSGSAGPGAAPVRGGAVPPSVTIQTGRSVSVGPVTGGVPGPGGVAGSSATPANLSRIVLTDATGQFSFPRMPAGQFTVSISHSQYLALNYGQRRSGGPGAYIPLTDGQQLALKITMLKGAVISGTIFSADGAPQPNAQIRGWRYMMVNGVKRLQSTGYATADDRGMYRMFGLQPGDYLISATPSFNNDIANRSAAQYDQIEQAIASGQVIPPVTAGLTPTVSVTVTNLQQPVDYVPPPGYLPTFAPSSPAPSAASAVTVAANEERTGVDVFVRLTQASVVQGEVSTPVDPGVNVQLMLVNDDPLEAFDTNGNQTDAKGKFIFRGVRPGKYTVLAQTVPQPPAYTQGQPQQTPTPLTDAQKMWGRASVTVSGEPTIDVSIALKPTRSISGAVVFEMARPPDLTRVRMSVALTPAVDSTSQAYFGAFPQGQVGPDGRFTITGVVPGRYSLRLNGVGLLKSATVGAQDTLDFPLQFTGENDVTGAMLTATDVISELGGTLTDAAGKPASDYFIIVATTDNRYWTPGSRRILTARPGPDGRYTLRALPPGSYYLGAVTDFEQGTQFDPEFLRALAGSAVTVTVMDGGKVQQDLRVK
jgi:hypothetical protein